MGFKEIRPYPWNIYLFTNFSKHEYLYNKFLKKIKRAKYEKGVLKGTWTLAKSLGTHLQVSTSYFTNHESKYYWKKRLMGKV